MNNNPIIFIPGVFDSKLYYDQTLTKLAWPLKTVAALKSLATFDDLIKLEQERADAELYVRTPVNDASANFPEYGVDDHWKPFIENVIAAFPNRQVWFYSYDFRKLTSETCVEFNTFLKSFNSQVDVICHSYGNCLLASYMTRYGGDKIERAACLAPPFQGSAEIFLVPPKSPNFACMNELCPSPALNEVYPVTLRKAPGEPAEVVDEAGYNNILAGFFHGKYEKVDFSGLYNHPGVHFGLGSGRLTAMATEFTLDEEGNPYVSDYSFGHAGDATVPVVSGANFGALKDKCSLFPGVAHTEFYKEMAVVFWSVMQLNSNDPPIHPYEIEKAPYVKIMIEGAVDVHVRKPFSVTDIISPTQTQSIGAESDLIGPRRDVNILALDPQECIIEIISIMKRESMDITISTYNAQEELTETRTEHINSRFVRFTMDKNGVIGKPFVLDLAGAAKLPDIKIPELKLPIGGDKNKTEE